MALYQPVPFEYKKGVLVDAIGNPVNFKNKHNLSIIAQLFSVAQETSYMVEQTIDDANCKIGQVQRGENGKCEWDEELANFAEDIAYNLDGYDNLLHMAEVY